MQERRVDTKGRIKVGDIIYRTTHTSHTDVYYYIVTKVMPKTIIAKRMDRAFTTEYCSNTPYDTCVPVINDMPYAGDEVKYDPNRYSFIETYRRKDEIKGRAIEIMYDNEWLKERDWEFRIKDEDREYYRLWNFEPQDVNCD